MTTKDDEMTFATDEITENDGKEFWQVSGTKKENTRIRLNLSVTPKKEKSKNNRSVASTDNRSVTPKGNTSNMDGRFSFNDRSATPKGNRVVSRIKTPMIKAKVSDDKVSNGKTLSTIENEKKQEKRAVDLKRLNQLYLNFNQKKEKLNLLREEKSQKQSENEMTECTFQPKLTQNRKYKIEVDFGSRNTKWKDDANSKIEKIKEKNEEALQKNFKPAIHTAPKFKPKIDDTSTRKYFQRIKQAKMLKMETEKKKNPDYNSIYDKLYKKPVKASEEYATFNPNKTKFDLNTIKVSLHNELNSLTIDPDI